MADEHDADFDVEGGAGDLALRTEMALSEFGLRHWKTIAGVLAGIVVAFAIYGQVQAAYVSGQRAIASDIAAVEGELGNDMLTLAQMKAGVRPGEEIDVPELMTAASDLVAVAESGSGTGAVEAWLKAAELYRIAGDTAARRGALQGAASAASGVLRYAAVAALANLDLEEGSGEQALTRFRELRDAGPDFLTRQATLDLAGTFEALGRTDEAVSTYDAWLSSYADDAAVEDVRMMRDRAAAGSSVPAPDEAPAPEEAPVPDEASDDAAGDEPSE